MEEAGPVSRHGGWRPRFQLMGSSRRPLRILMAAMVVTALGGQAEALASGSSMPVSGGAAIAPPTQPTSAVSAASTAPPGPGSHGVWLSKVNITEYWPVPESWFVGALVTAPGLPGKHRIDWLYSAQ